VGGALIIMAEMSFGPRMRAARAPSKENPADFMLNALGLGNALNFMQGCVMERPPPISDPDALLVVDFPDRPSKMLAAAIADYGPASLLKVQLCDCPRLPMGKLKSTEVVLKVYACGVNPTDWKQRKGTLSTMCPLSLPCVLGIDLAGKVVRAGEESPFAEGDEVFGRQTLDRMRVLNGSYAEYCIVEGADIYKKPARLSWEEAAGVPHASLAAYSALARVGRLHEKVLSDHLPLPPRSRSLAPCRHQLMYIYMCQRICVCRMHARAAQAERQGRAGAGRQRRRGFLCGADREAPL
jgi:hypothetical protein